MGNWHAVGYSYGRRVTEWFDSPSAAIQYLTREANRGELAIHSVVDLDSDDTFLCQGQTTKGREYIYPGRRGGVSAKVWNRLLQEPFTFKEIDGILYQLVGDHIYSAHDLTFEMLLGHFKLDEGPGWVLNLETSFLTVDHFKKLNEFAETYLEDPNED